MRLSPSPSRRKEPKMSGQYSFNVGNVHVVFTFAGAHRAPTDADARNALQLMNARNQVSASGKAGPKTHMMITLNKRLILS